MVPVVRQPPCQPAKMDHLSISIICIKAAKAATYPTMAVKAHVLYTMPFIMFSTWLHSLGGEQVGVAAYITTVPYTARHTTDA